MNIPQKANFGELLAKTILPKVQLIALLVAVIGLIFHYLNLNGSADMLMIGFSALAGAFFLSAFAIVTISPAGKHSRIALLLYKIIYLAAPVVLIGVLFYILKFEGYHQLLLMGCIGLGGGILLAATQISNRDNLRILFKPLITTLPVFLLGLYFLYKLSTL
ncbi:MAG: hypothetical protein DYG99_00420 [Bacteroidetes bacterium CHB5]|nr:hypothetical protein [Bacteroidetes bacterium CHB5]